MDCGASVRAKRSSCATTPATAAGTVPWPVDRRQRATSGLRCTCPGADTPRRSFDRAEAKRGELAAVFADVDLSDHPDAETTERRLRAAFQAHGEQLPRHLTGLSELVAAAGGRRGSRSARFLGLGARSLAGGVRWAWQPGADADAKDRRAFRDMYMSFGAFIGIAILLTTVAFRASGWRRLPWAVIALLMWLFITWSVAIGVLVATVAAGGKDARHMGGPAGSDARLVGEES